VTVLSDRDLARLYPTAQAIGPASIDLHLGDALLTLEQGAVLDPEADQSALWKPVPRCVGGAGDGRWRLEQGRPYLGVTRERLTVDSLHLALLHGVSSVGRLFLLIHVTAGVVDPGWTDGRLTLELFPLGAPVYLRPGQRIGQLTLHELSSRCERPYGHADLCSKYQGDAVPVPSRSFRDWEAAT